jgi:hypothetical protein
VEGALSVKDCERFGYPKQPFPKRTAPAYFGQVEEPVVSASILQHVSEDLSSATVENCEEILLVRVQVTQLYEQFRGSGIALKPHEAANLSIP